MRTSTTRRLDLRVQLLQPAEHVRLVVAEVVEVRVHRSDEQALLLVVQPQLVRSAVRLLAPPRDDERGVPGRPVLVGLAALGLVGPVGALRDAEQCPQAFLGHHRSSSYIRKMPNVDSGTGAFSAAEIPSASTRRVSRGSMMPSSQSRAVEK